MSDDLFVYGRDTFAARQHFIAEQGDLCAICKTAPTALVLDHEHSEESLCRGLLCHGCNVGLGSFKDDPNRLRAGADYIEAHEPRTARYRETADWGERRVTVKRRPLTKPELERRNRRIRDAFELGKSSKTIAAQFDISVGRVNQILYPVKRGAAAAALASRAATLDERLDLLAAAAHPSNITYWLHPSAADQLRTLAA